MKKVEAVGRIAGAFEDWLKAEVITSGEGRNRYLDPAGKTPEELQKAFDELKSMLVLPYEDERNWMAQKDKSHQRQRVPHWMIVFETSVGTPTEDFYAAQAEFAPLMTAAGSRRAEGYLESRTPDEYAAMRALGTGIDLEKAVTEELSDRVFGLDFSAADVSFSGLTAAFYETYGQTSKYFRALNERHMAEVAEDGDEPKVNFTEENVALSVADMKQSQINHIKLATDCVLLAAKLRKGDLAAVPFLEPLSISDQSGKVYFPLAEPVDWLAVLGGRR